jgi:thiol-disulfide isomerase/thioredoxin
MLPLGTVRPEFALPDPHGKTWSHTDFAGRPLLAMFICNHCPYVKHIRDAIAAFGRDYTARIGIVAINSNDTDAYPDDDLAHMAEEVRDAGYLFPYLLDESQELAKAFRAACTPEFYLFDAEAKLVYRGQFDDSRPNNDLPVTGADLRAAVDALLAGRPMADEQKPSIGCNIKWRPGNEPDYFG